jgi:DNA-binding NarL/FixJ family response regulator
METKKATHIFIVENDRYYVNMLDYIFSKNILFRFLDFKTGEDCLKSMHLNPAVVVLDYSLPGMNGYETLEEIKEQNPDTHVIMLLSESDGRLPAEFLNAGADDYVLKDGNEITKIISKIEDRLETESSETGLHKKAVLPSLKKKIYYALIILLLLTVGVYYYQ